MRPIFLALIIILPLTWLQAEEKILRFHADIIVEPSGDLLITETIRVVAEGHEIKRGIYRDLPIAYHNEWGLKLKPPFEILSVERDGKGEQFHTEPSGQSLRVYIGQSERLLPPGQYEYRLRYRTGRQLFHHPNHDELYWNVTGNAWSFPIDRASVRVALPSGGLVQGFEAYTGPVGSVAQDWDVTGNADGVFVLQTTATLPPGSGLTLVLTWEKGIVAEPSEQELRDELIEANLPFVGGFLLTLGGMGYLFIMWLLVGKDPPKGIVIPRYEPPDGFDPASARFLARNGTQDNTSFTAAILHLAVEGFLIIKNTDGKNFTLEQTDKPLNFAEPAEAALAEALFASGNSVALSRANYRQLAAARNALDKAVKKPLLGTVFHFHRGKWAIGLIMVLGGLLLAGSQTATPPVAIFMTIWLTGWSFGVLVLIKSTIQSFRSKQYLGGAFMGLFSIPFIAAWCFGTFMLAMGTSLIFAALLLGGVAGLGIFYFALRAPTHAGRKILDEIDGLKLYLSVAERDRMNLENPPEQTPAVFERFLPYALALGVEQQWSQQFADLLQSVQWQPRWASGQGVNWSRPMTGIPAFTSGFSSALQSSSSSSSSGGGSSGGGRGGGGGGGW